MKENNKERLASEQASREYSEQVEMTTIMERGDNPETRKSLADFAQAEKEHQEQLEMMRNL